MTELRVVRKTSGLGTCDHCPDMAQWLIFDESTRKCVATLCKNHKDKFMMEQL